MKFLRVFLGFVLIAFLSVVSARGQIQVAGTLLVNLDPSSLPLGPISSVPNSGSAGGVFEATGLAAVSEPVVVAVGGGARGIMFDGNNFMQHVAAPGGAKVNLPGALAAANAPYSIECWVMNPTTWASDAETMVYWGVRGTAGAHTAFSYSANAAQGAMDHWGNNLNWLLLPSLAAWHHLVYTFDGATQKIYEDGVLDASVPITGVLHPTATQPITLAAQRNSDGSLVGAGGVHGSLTLGKVRIHTGVLTDAQVAANYALENPGYVMAPSGLSSAPTHRYTFNNAAASDATGQTVPDVGSVGGANGIVRGSAGTATFTGKKLSLTGGSSATAPYVDLPNGLLSNLSNSKGGSGKVTLEGWVTLTGNQTWARLFDFGSTTIGEVTAAGGTFNGVNYFELSQNNTYRDWAQCEIMNNGYNGGPNLASTRAFGMENDNSAGYGLSHYAVTWDEASGEVIVYENGVEATRFTTTTKFTGINDVNVWLGRSNWAGDSNLLGNYDEFRIFNRVLSAAEVQNDYKAGPDAVALDPGALQGIHLLLPHTNLLAGATDQVTLTGDYASVTNVVVSPNAGFEFATSDTNIVTISAAGMLQAVAAGSATLSVTNGAFSDSNTVTVVSDPGALLGVRLVMTNRIQLYDSQPVMLRGDFANVIDVDLSGYGPTLTSANSNIVAITPGNRITAVAPGATTILAVYNGQGSSKSVTSVFPTNRFIFDSFGDGFWTIVNQANTNTLVVGASGASQAVSTNTAFDQQFEILYNIQNSTFRIRNHASWLCIAAQSGGNTPGTGVTTVPAYNGANWQQWYLVDVGGGFYRIVNSSSGLALQTDNGAPAKVTLAPASSSPLQRWQFVYQTHYPKKGSGGYGDFYSTFNQPWVYSWGYTSTWNLPAGSVFEPMQWGNWNVDTSTYNAWHATEKPMYLMGFNEPDNSSQANMTTVQAISLWPQLLGMNLPLLSPAAQNTYSSWMYDFFNKAANAGYRVDYTAVHLYVNPDATGLINNLQNAYNTWGRPVWLTEFSPVDWAGTATWSEQDDYNFLAEFMWMAEDQLWLKRYGLFLFSGTPSTNPWDANGHRGDTFLADGKTLTPYGELFATWDADRTMHGRSPYLIQNLATSFRLTSSNNVAVPRASSIRVRNATTEWELFAATTTNHWYIISLSDGRRLRDTAGALDLAPVGTAGPPVEWTFTGPDSKGYYFIGNPAYGHNLNGSGTAPTIAFSATSAATQNNNTRWRLVKPYLPPAAVSAPTVPTSPTATPGNQSVALQWLGANRFYNVYRSSNSGTGYVRVASALTTASFTDNTVSNNVPYYYVVTGMNILGEESTNSIEVSATPSVASAWRQQWFGTTANSGTAADSADPDSDGIINVLERAFNLNPTVADTNGTPFGTLSDTNFTLNYRKNLSATDLSFQVMRSFDLATWSSNGVMDAIISSDGSTEIHGASVPLIDGSAQFLQLQVTAPP